MTIPNDPIILLSFINTQLRDFYESLEDLCLSMNIDKTSLVSKLEQVDYSYDRPSNQFK
ncbi:MAG: DUF4250 domain-containing protein [Velocimicrobium sp.]